MAKGKVEKHFDGIGTEKQQRGEIYFCVPFGLGAASAAAKVETDT